MIIGKPAKIITVEELTLMIAQSIPITFRVGCAQPGHVEVVSSAGTVTVQVRAADARLVIDYWLNQRIVRVRCHQN